MSDQNVKIESGDPEELDELRDDQVVFRVTAFRRTPSDDNLGCGIEFGEITVEAKLEAVHVVMNILDQTRLQLEHKIIHEAMLREQKMRKARREVVALPQADGVPN